MPRRNRTAYNRYMKEYLKKYREFRKWQREGVRKAVLQGNSEWAKEILKTKPSQYWNKQKRNRGR